jgi:hypothetical protein
MTAPVTESRTVAPHEWIDAVAAIADPEDANRAITEAHFTLSEMLAGVLGPDVGANFHTWAVWGSREAGTTIGRHDIPRLRSRVGATAAVVGFLIGLLIGGLLVAALVASIVGLLALGLTHVALDRARTHISHGNRIVLEEIGGVTARFVAAFPPGSDTVPGPVHDVLDALAPGPTADGGQDLLREAFGAYLEASEEPDRERRHQLVFAANCFAVWHEHLRLQHDIAAAMPRPLRTLITRTLLDFSVGPEHLHVGRDLTPVEGAVWPTTLCSLTEPRAVAACRALRDPERAPDTLVGSAATSWASLPQRMDYVVDLFRSRHLAPGVFEAPFTPHR